MRELLTLLAVLACLGCGQSATESAATAKGYIEGWDKGVERLPDETQISFFRSYLHTSQKPLTEALQNPSSLIRMWASYVIGQIGPKARILDPVLAERLQNEPDRLVRIYLYEALRQIKDDTPSTISLLKQTFKSLDETKEQQDSKEIIWGYLDSDEKIQVAATICTFDQGPERIIYLNYMLNWLQNPGTAQTMRERYYWWMRRREVVLLLEGTPDANQAKRLMENMQAETDAPWEVYFDVKRVLESLK